MNSFSLGTIFLCVQLLASELIFMFAAKKRKRFAIRLPLASIGYFFFACMLPSVAAFHFHPLYQLVWVLAVFLGSIAVMAVCFQLKWWPLFSLCVAGYAVQHIGFHVCNLIGHTQVFTGAAGSLISRSMRIEMLFLPGIYLIMFLIFGLFCAQNEIWKKVDMRFGGISVITVFICVGVTRLTRQLGEYNTISVSIYAILCCLLALVVQLILFQVVDLQNENILVHALWQEDRRQYELSKKTIDLINIKSHDLKHKLSSLQACLPEEEIESIKNILRIYDSNYKTGNSALDVLLTESSLHCAEQGILLTFTGNGQDLAFMNDMDVYSLFGNAISNAIEAAQKLEDPNKKLVNIVVERLGDLVNISVANYFSGFLRMVDDIPETTKKEEEGYHGFGMKSMRLLAGKYGGGLSIRIQEDLFTLGVYLFNT